MDIDRHGRLPGQAADRDGLVAMPGLFFSWGGGNLDYYAQAGKLVDLDPVLESHFLPSALQAGIYNGKLIGVPMPRHPAGVHLLQQAGLRRGRRAAARDLEELTNLVTTFKNKDITPVRDRGHQHQLVDRADVDRVPGGPAAPGPTCSRSSGGDWSQWKDPAVLKAAEMVKELVDSRGVRQQLRVGQLRRGRHLDPAGHGQGGDVPDGVVGVRDPGRGSARASPRTTWATCRSPPFPAARANAANVVGNPTNYISVTTAARGKTAADFLATTYSTATSRAWSAMGEVPVTTNAKPLLAGAADPAYANFLYDLVSKAPHFTQSWDQALGSDPRHPDADRDPEAVQRPGHARSSSSATCWRSSRSSRKGLGIVMVSVASSVTVRDRAARRAAPAVERPGAAWAVPGWCSSSSSPSCRWRASSTCPSRTGTA